MGIGAYIREIGRGKDGARPLDRAQTADLFGQVLDGGLTDLEVGAFCLAMRIKGETAQEMSGFLDATHARMHAIPAGSDDAPPTIVIPSYNGARKLPVLTPLLALLLARAGLPVLVHGAAPEDKRVFSGAVFAALGVPPMAQITPIAVTFTVPQADLDRTKALLEAEREAIGYQKLTTDPKVAKVSVVGVGMRSHAGVAATMFKSLADRGINIQAISTSEIKVSVLIDADEVELAVRVLHTAYGLDAG